MLALITGAGTGIGASCAFKFAEEGYDLVLVCNKSSIKAGKVAAQAKLLGSKAIVFAVDLKDPDAISRTAEAVITSVGVPDVIVNNAGVWHGGVIQDMSKEIIDEIFDVNIKGMIYICKAFADAMIEKRKGSIINISSMWGKDGASCESIYSASKGAVDAFTKSLAKELGPSGIRVNAVAPGVILTDMCACYSEDELKELAEEAPLGKNGMPKDVANTVYYLANEEASYITGQIIGVNGGFSI